MLNQIHTFFNCLNETLLDIVGNGSHRSTPESFEDRPTSENNKTHLTYVVQHAQTEIPTKTARAL